MIIADTSIWIEYFRQSNPDTNKKFSEFLESASIVALSAVFGELLQGVRNEREEKVILEHWKLLPKLNEEDLFIEAGRISNQFNLFNKGVGLIDCYLLAASRINRFEIWTLDKKLLDAIRITNS